MVTLRSIRILCLLLGLVTVQAHGLSIQCLYSLGTFWRGWWNQPREQISETDLKDLYLAMHLLPEAMPSYETFVGLLGPGDSEFLKSMRDRFYEGLPISEGELERYRKIFAPVVDYDQKDNTPLGRNANGGFKGVTRGRYQGEVLALPVLSQATAKERHRAEKLGLPLFEGGRIAMKSNGSRTTVGRLETDFLGYRYYFDESGHRYLSLLPLDGASPEEIVKLYRFIKEKTEGEGMLSNLVGIHFYRGQARLLFEPLTEILPWQQSELTQDELAGVTGAIEKSLSPRAGVWATSEGTFHFGYPLEQDYLFVKDGTLRVGVPVRAGGFAEAVYQGKVFRLKNDAK